jgi:hypothetical protein
MRSGGKKPRRKSNREERHLVALLQEAGFAAERVPLSGSVGGSYIGDVSVPLLGVDRVVEVKCRAQGFRRLYDWLDGRDLLILRADRCLPLVVLPLRLATEIVRHAENAPRENGGAR